MGFQETSLENISDTFCHRTGRQRAPTPQVVNEMREVLSGTDGTLTAGL
jgi:hypothetical protein